VGRKTLLHFITLYMDPDPLRERAILWRFGLGSNQKLRKGGCNCRAGCAAAMRFFAELLSQLVFSFAVLKLGGLHATYHGLRGGASPVLTATGFVNGRWQFSTPHRIHTP